MLSKAQVWMVYDTSDLKTEEIRISWVTYDGGDKINESTLPEKGADKEVGLECSSVCNQKLS